MEQDDPELEKDLEDAGALAAEDEDIQMEEENDGEFQDNEGDLDLPDEEELVDDN
jgi:hypothetical protein